MLPRKDRLVIAFLTKEIRGDWLARLDLTPWSDDDLIEYLLAVHPRQCASVMQRLGKSAREGGLLGGVPELWTVVLDELAAATPRNRTASSPSLAWASSSTSAR